MQLNINLAAFVIRERVIFSLGFHTHTHPLSVFLCFALFLSAPLEVYSLCKINVVVVGFGRVRCLRLWFYLAHRRKARTETLF